VITSLIVKNVQYFLVISLRFVFFLSTRIITIFNGFIIIVKKRCFNVAIVIPINPNLITNKDVLNCIQIVSAVLVDISMRQINNSSFVLKR